MKYLLSILSALMMVVSFSSCEKIEGDGPVYTEDRTRESFTGIDLRVAGNVYYDQSPVHKVEVTAQRNVLDVLETYVSNNRLVIKFENDVRVRNHEDIVVKVSGPDVTSLRVIGPGDIYASGVLHAGRMDLQVSGSGNIMLHELEADVLDAEISGSGDINVDHGTAMEQKLKISGSGNLNLSDLVSRKASTITSGSGDMRLHVMENLDVRITGSGNVYYHGNPVVNTSISGSGRVRHF